MKPFNECLSPLERELKEMGKHKEPVSHMEKNLLHHQFHIKEMRELHDFKNFIINLCSNFTRTIETKIHNQDLKIKNVYENIGNMHFKYDPETESLTLEVQNE